MTRFCPKRLVGMMAILWALTGCAAPMSAISPTAIPAQPRPSLTPAPQASATPGALPSTPTPAPVLQVAYLLTVLSTQDRPDEMPSLPYREDNFAQAQPWEISEGFHPGAGNRFYAAQIAAFNADSANWQFNPSALALTDENGTTYPAQLGRTAQGLTAFDLRPGQWTSGWVVFELPEAAIPRKATYTLPHGQRLEATLNFQASLSVIAPARVTVTRSSGFGWSVRLISVKDPGEPFSTYAYTYIAGHRPLNLRLEVTNQTGAEAPFYPHQFVLMDEHGRLYRNNPGGASESFDGGDLLPGETRQGEVSFDLPEGVKASQLFYFVLPFTEQVLQIALQP